MNTKSRALSAVASVLLALGVAACGQSSSTLSRVTGGDSVEIKPTDMVHGAKDAPVTIVEYASMTCPHCAAFHKGTYPALKTKYIETGKVRFIFREFPLDDLAVAASMLARCAGGEKTMALIDVLFASQDKWAVREPLPALLQIGKQAGFTQATFDECLKDQKLYNNILAMRERGSKEYKVESTPTLFVNGKMVKGGVSIEELEKLMAPLLKS